MSIFTRKYSKFMMLSGMVLISALSAEQAYSTTVTTLLNANHRITWHNGNKVNGIFYIRAEAPLITIMNVDYKGIANVRRGYTLDAAITYFFRTGERSISSYSWVGNLRRGFGTVPERSANIRLDFRKACGLKGGIASFVKLRNKSTGAYLRIVQGPRDIPFAGGIVPVAIDCRVPTISKINGSAPDRLNNMCVDTHGSYGLSIRMVDDIGIGNVEVSSNNPALRISPSRIGSAHIRKASGKNLFTADFSMRANNAGPINRVGPPG